GAGAAGLGASVGLAGAAAAAVVGAAAAAVVGAAAAVVGAAAGAVVGAAAGAVVGAAAGAAVGEAAPPQAATSGTTAMPATVVRPRIRLRRDRRSDMLGLPSMRLRDAL